MRAAPSPYACPTTRSRSTSSPAPARSPSPALAPRTGPLAVPSATRRGPPPATTMLDARLQLGAAVGVYLDGGPRPSATPVRIVDLTGEAPRLLREGALSADMLRDHGVEAETPA